MSEIFDILLIRYMAIACLVLVVLLYISKKIGPWMLKRRMDEMMKNNPQLRNTAVLKVMKETDTRLLVELVNRCIAYGDYVALKANFIFEGEEGKELPKLWIHVYSKDDKDRVLFQSEVHSNAAMLIWYRVTRENGFTVLKAIDVTWNEPERKHTGGGRLL